MNHLIFILLITIVATGCKTTHMNSSAQEKNLITQSVDCMTDRKEVKKMTMVQGVVEMINKEPHIFIKEASARLIACNNPAGLKAGDSVVFSANIKEIYPHERRSGTPCVLTFLTKESQ